MKMLVKLPPLYPILGASLLPEFEPGSYLTRVVCELEYAGVTLLQYRNKRGEHKEILADAELMRGATTSAVTLIMNDHPDLAVQARFDGVHVGQTDVSPAEARAIVGLDGIVGISTHNLAQLEAANKMPVDYIAFGPVFATSSKLNHDPVVGLDGLREARALTKKPLVAIGGITPENARGVLDAGADSAAMISALFGPGKDSAKIAKDFLSNFR
jgi:thiamine-phosphate pyrophosphorylase